MSGSEGVVDYPQTYLNNNNLSSFLKLFYWDNNALIYNLLLELPLLPLTLLIFLLTPIPVWGIELHLTVTQLAATAMYWIAVAGHTETQTAQVAILAIQETDLNNYC